MTVSTPTLTPRIVSAERSLLALNVSSAIREDSFMSSSFISHFRLPIADGPFSIADCRLPIADFRCLSVSCDFVDRSLVHKKQPACYHEIANRQSKIGNCITRLAEP